MLCQFIGVVKFCGSVATHSVGYLDGVAKVVSHDRYYRSVGDVKPTLCRRCASAIVEDNRNEG